MKTLIVATLLTLSANAFAENEYICKTADQTYQMDITTGWNRAGLWVQAVLHNSQSGVSEKYQGIEEAQPFEPHIPPPQPIFKIMNQIYFKLFTQTPGTLDLTFKSKPICPRCSDVEVMPIDELPIQSAHLKTAQHDLKMDCHEK